MIKLTLSMEEDVVDKAKQIAEANKTSVSAMFSQFVQSMVVHGMRPTKIGPLTRKLSGMVKLPPGKDYKDLITDNITDKYRIIR
jgi:Family of unknown function (DUF6364)